MALNEENKIGSITNNGFNDILTRVHPILYIPYSSNIFVMTRTCHKYHEFLLVVNNLSIVTKKCRLVNMMSIIDSRYLLPPFLYCNL